MARELPPGGVPVSVVIPCLNEANHLCALLDAVFLQDVLLHEVLVVDNGSTDGSQDVVRALQLQHPDRPLRLLTCDAVGAAAAMNEGIRTASGDVIVRFDGHCVPRPDYVRHALQRLLQDDSVGVVGGLWEVTPGRESLVGRAIAAVLSHPLATGGAAYRRRSGVAGPVRVDTVPFGCFRKSLWQALEGYDERLKVNEDYVFNYRTRLSGKQVVLDPAIRSMYIARRSLGRLAAQYFQYGWRKAEMLKTFPRSVRWRQIVPGAFTALLALLAGAGVIDRTAWLVLAAITSVYVVALVAAAVQAGRRSASWGVVPVSVLAFAIIQLAWGAGACVNVLTLGRWPGWNAAHRLVLAREGSRG